MLGIWGSATKVETEDGKIQYVDGFEGEPTWAEYTCPDYNGVCWTVGCKNQSGIISIVSHIFRKLIFDRKLKFI